MNVDPVKPNQLAESDISAGVFNSGTVNLNGFAWLRLYNASNTFVNDGTFNMANGSTLSSEVSGVQFNNHASFTAGNATVSGFGGASIFNNSGTVDVESGTLQLQGSGSAAGYVNTGTFKAGANGVITVQGAATLHDGTSLIGAGATTFGNVAADGLVTVSGNVFFGGGSWTETGTLQVAAGGVFTWQNGNIACLTAGSPSLVQVDRGGSLNLNSGGGYLQLLQTVIDNHGSIAWTNGGSFLLGNTAVPTNESDGIFDAQCDGILGATSGGGNATAAFYNQGLFKKSAGAANDATAIALPFYSSGALSVINVSAGTLKFSGGSDGTFSTGVLVAAFPGIVEFSAGTHHFDRYGFDGSGKVIADGANLLADYDYSVADNGLTIIGNFELAGGFVGGAGVIGVSQGGTMTWSGGTMGLGVSQVPNLGWAQQTVIYGRLDITAGGNVNLIDRSLYSFGGTIAWSGAGNILCSQTSGNTNQAIVNNGTLDIQNDAQINGLPLLENTGLLKKSGAGGTTSLNCNVKNTGTIEVDSGTLEMGLQYWDLATGTLAANGKVVLHGCTIKYDAPQQPLYGDVTGSGVIQAPQGLDCYGHLQFLLVEIEGDLDVKSQIELGDAPGRTTIDGNCLQDAAAALTAPLAGANAATPDFGQLVVTGSATLAGALRVTLENGFAPAPGAQFQILSAGSRSGTFGTLYVPAGISVNYSNTGVFLVVTGAVPVQVLSPQLSAGAFNFGFNTISNRSYTVQSAANLTSPNWILFTNFIGNGSVMRLATPITNATRQFFRVSEP